jgi:hypothetical protein
MFSFSSTHIFVGLVTGLFALIILLGIFAKTSWGGVPPAKPRELNNDTVIDAIVEAENWDGHSIGANGERGPFSFKRATWQQYSSKPFFWADCTTLEQKTETRRVALRYAVWIRGVMHDMAMKQDAFTFALIWNAGFTRVIKGAASFEQRSYAKRVQVLYDDLAK